MRRTLSRLLHSSLSRRTIHTQHASLKETKETTLNTWDDPTAVVEPAQDVMAVCKTYDIGLPQHLRPLNNPQLKGNPFRLSVAASQKHCFAQQSMRYFDTVDHPFAKSLLEIYIEKKKEPLWLYCVAHGGPPFPMKKAAKKLAHAVRDALAEAGYDRYGRRVPVDGESSVIADLHGSLRVISTDPLAVCNAKFVDILVWARRIVVCAELSLRRDKNGQHPTKQQSRPYPPRKDMRQGQKHKQKAR